MSFSLLAEVLAQVSRSIAALLAYGEQ